MPKASTIAIHTRPKSRPKPKSKSKLGVTRVTRICKARGCKVEFTPTGPRQLYHDVACRDKEAHRRQRAIAKATTGQK